MTATKNAKTEECLVFVNNEDGARKVAFAFIWLEQKKSGIVGTVHVLIDGRQAS
jgi:hypothetical protein